MLALMNWGDAPCNISEGFKCETERGLRGLHAPREGALLLVIVRPELTNSFLL